MRESIRIDARRKMPQHLAIQLGRLASIMALTGDQSTAARLLGASQALMDEIGADRAWWQGERDAETLALIRSALGDDEADAQIRIGRSLPTADAVTFALGTEAGGSRA
ncbi:hypothetical protein BH23CHL7_BH23CHL7_05110 [soil metagenome]